MKKTFWRNFVVFCSISLFSAVWLEAAEDLDQHPSSLPSTPTLFRVSGGGTPVPNNDVYVRVGPDKTSDFVSFGDEGLEVVDETVEVDEPWNLVVPLLDDKGGEIEPHYVKKEHEVPDYYKENLKALGGQVRHPDENYVIFLNSYFGNENNFFKDSRSKGIDKEEEAKALSLALQDALKKIEGKSVPSALVYGLLENASKLENKNIKELDKDQLVKELFKDINLSGYDINKDTKMFKIFDPDGEKDDLYGTDFSNPRAQTAFNAQGKPVGYHDEWGNFGHLKPEELHQTDKVDGADSKLYRKRQVFVMPDGRQALSKIISNDDGDVLTIEDNTYEVTLPGDEVVYVKNDKVVPPPKSFTQILRELAYQSLQVFGFGGAEGQSQAPSTSASDEAFKDSNNELFRVSGGGTPDPNNDVYIRVNPDKTSDFVPLGDEGLKVVDKPAEVDDLNNLTAYGKLMHEQHKTRVENSYRDNFREPADEVVIDKLFERLEGKVLSPEVELWAHKEIAKYKGEETPDEVVSRIFKLAESQPYNISKDYTMKKVFDPEGEEKDLYRAFTSGVLFNAQSEPIGSATDENFKHLRLFDTGKTKEIEGEKGLHFQSENFLGSEGEKLYSERVFDSDGNPNTIEGDVFKVKVGDDKHVLVKDNEVITPERLEVLQAEKDFEAVSGKIAYFVNNALQMLGGAESQALIPPDPTPSPEEEVSVEQEPTKVEMDALTKPLRLRPYVREGVTHRKNIYGGEVKPLSNKSLESTLGEPLTVGDYAWQVAKYGLPPVLVGIAAYAGYQYFKAPEYMKYPAITDKNDLQSNLQKFLSEKNKFARIIERQLPSVTSDDDTDLGTVLIVEAEGDASVTGEEVARKMALDQDLRYISVDTAAVAAKKDLIKQIKNDIAAHKRKKDNQPTLLYISDYETLPADVQEELIKYKEEEPGHDREVLLALGTSSLEKLKDFQEQAQVTDRNLLNIDELHKQHQEAIAIEALKKLYLHGMYPWLNDQEVVLSIAKELKGEVLPSQVVRYLSSVSAQMKAEGVDLPNEHIIQEAFREVRSKDSALKKAYLELKERGSY